MDLSNFEFGQTYSSGVVNEKSHNEDLTGQTMICMEVKAKGQIMDCTGHKANIVAASQLRSDLTRLVIQY